MRKSKQSQIDELERTLKIEYEGIEDLRRKIENLNGEKFHLNNRIKDIAGENESLRMDKKWLQQQLSMTLQTVLSRSPR